MYRIPELYGWIMDSYEKTQISGYLATVWTGMREHDLLDWQQFRWRTFYWYLAKVFPARPSWKREKYEGHANYSSMIRKQRHDTSDRRFLSQNHEIKSHTPFITMDRTTVLLTKHKLKTNQHAILSIQTHRHNNMYIDYSDEKYSASSNFKAAPSKRK